MTLGIVAGSIVSFGVLVAAFSKIFGLFSDIVHIKDQIDLNAKEILGLSKKIEDLHKLITGIVNCENKHFKLALKEFIDKGVKNGDFNNPQLLEIMNALNSLNKSK